MQPLADRYTNFNATAPIDNLFKLWVCPIPMHIGLMFTLFRLCKMLGIQFPFFLLEHFAKINPSDLKTCIVICTPTFISLINVALRLFFLGKYSRPYAVIQGLLLDLVLHELFKTLLLFIFEKNHWKIGWKSKKVAILKNFFI